MRGKSAAAAALLLAVVLLFSGCGAFTFNSAENLVRPPKLSGDDGNLQAAFENAVSEKGEYVLKYPSDGEYRSAFVRYDIDGDGSDEAFVFYSLRSEAMSVYMCVLDYTNGRWNAVGSFPGEGNDIYSIEFCDLNNDGTSEVLVGWSSLDAKSNKKLAVYGSPRNSENLNYRVLAVESYTSMYTCDLDGDSEEEILLALINSTSDTYTTEARLLKMSSDGGDFQINAVGQVSLYSEMTAVNAVTSGISGGRRCIYIDETAGDTYLTEMIYWDGETNMLVAPIKVDMLTIASCPTSRRLPLNCDDIDGDGEIEIPSTLLLQNSSVMRISDAEGENKTTAENVYIVNWKKFSDGDLITTQSYIENEEDGFRIEFDLDSMRDWCVTFFPDEHMSQFFMLKKSDDPENETESVMLFSVRAVEPNEQISIGSYLAMGDEYKYTYEITDEGEEAGITRSYIASIFEGSIKNEKNTYRGR